MRCRNCGWSNSEGRQICEKCKFPLEAEHVKNDSPSAPSAVGTPEENLRKTIRESRPIAAGNPVNVTNDASCPKCGYPLAAGTDYCPSCGYEINIKPKKTAPRNATINPWARRDNVCTLTPIGWDGNTLPNASHIEEFQDKAILNRDNTMPDNKTITSQEQAEIVYKDGHWTIVDKSEQHTTFVLATREVELHNGDVVMLGNQLFRFNDGNV